MICWQSVLKLIRNRDFGWVIFVMLYLGAITSLFSGSGARLQLFFVTTDVLGWCSQRVVVCVKSNNWNSLQGVFCSVMRCPCAADVPWRCCWGVAARGCGRQQTTWPSACLPPGKRPILLICSQLYYWNHTHSPCGCLWLMDLFGCTNVRLQSSMPLLLSGRCDLNDWALKISSQQQAFWPLAITLVMVAWVKRLGSCCENSIAARGRIAVSKPSTWRWQWHRQTVQRVYHKIKWVWERNGEKSVCEIFRIPIKSPCPPELCYQLEERFRKRNNQRDKHGWLPLKHCAPLHGRAKDCFISLFPSYHNTKFSSFCAS